MSKSLKKTLFLLGYFLFWIIFHSVSYIISAEDITLLPHFKFGYKAISVIITFIKALPALEVAIILMLFTLSISDYSSYQLKRRSPLVIKIISKLFVTCIVFSALNFALSELIRPSLVYSRNNQMLTSQKYYENINLYSEAVANKDYEKAEQYLRTAFLIWDDSPEVQALQADLANMKEEKNKNLAFSTTDKVESIKIPENLAPQELLNISRECIARGDFYTAYHYSLLIMKLAKDDELIIAEAKEIEELTKDKIESGITLDMLLESQRQFEAKKSAYEALTQKDYEKSYYAFLAIQKEILAKTNKYDPDVEKHLKMARDRLLQEVFFIEEIESIPSFNSGYNIKFNIKERKERFNIGSFYFSNTKDSFAIYLSNVIYTKSRDDGSLLIQLKLPYAKIIEKEIDGKKSLYLLAEARSKYDHTKNIPSNANLQGDALNLFPLETKMSVDEFALIVLAQQEPHAMTIVDLYGFIPIAKHYGFDSYIYGAELCVRFADFFIFIIFTSLLSIVAFKMRPKYIDKCTFLFVIASIAFPYVIFTFLEAVRHIFKLFTTLLINIGMPIPCLIVMTFLFIIFLWASYLLYNVGDRS